MNISDEKIEELSRQFSFRLAEKLEKKEIGIDKASSFVASFFNCLNSAKDESEIEIFIEKI